MQGPIDVNDRLPEKLTDVFVFGVLEGEEVHDWHEGFSSPDLFSGEMRWCQTGTADLITEVTHWMPKPPDPRGTAASEPLRAVA